MHTLMSHNGNVAVGALQDFDERNEAIKPMNHKNECVSRMLIQIMARYAFICTIWASAAYKM